MKKQVLIVQNIPINLTSFINEDFICLTDMANGKESESRAADIIKNWLRNRYTIEFLGTWELINNPNFKVVEFDHFKTQAGLPSFVLSASEWIEKTNAIGITVKKGKYGGTYAHKDIAFEFGSAISVTFKLYLIKEYQRLKEEENDRLKLTWNLHRTLSKINYRIHTDAVKEHIIPASITKEQANFIYTNEADALNVALFGKTAKQWRDENTELDGNIRDYASIEQLLVLANIESMNAEFIRMELPQNERLTKLNQIAITQLKSLIQNPNVKKLK
ncbi:KilA-N domain-containing protein [Flavobacterium aestuarii]|uniref:KilA-N domain-containing protein n=1 Tax=Flavobacterium aestuarii TaxID=3149227 RepID=UPI0032B56FDE